MIRCGLLLVALVALGGCKGADLAQFKSLGSRHHITCYSGGKVIWEGDSTGNISNEAHSDGFYFRDEKTQKLVELSGQCVVLQL